MGSKASLISGLTTIFQDLTGKTAAVKANEVGTEIWDEVTTGSKISDADGDTYLELEEAADDDHARIYTVGTERVTVDDSGNVGIKNSSPQGLLHVGSGSFDTDFVPGTETMLYSGGENARFQMQGSLDVGLGLIDTGAGADDKFMQLICDGGVTSFRSITDAGGIKTANIIVMDHSSGNVGIGVSPSHILHVYTDIASGRAGYFHNDGNSANRYGIAVSAGTDDGSGTNYLVTVKDGDGDTEGGIRIVNGTVELWDSSDERLKKDIKETTLDAKSIIKGIAVKNYRLKKSNKEHNGFIAQDVQAIYPDAVGDPDLETGLIGYSRDKLVIPLWKAAQELMEQNEQQQKKIEELEKRIEKLEKK